MIGGEGAVCLSRLVLQHSLAIILSARLLYVSFLMLAALVPAVYGGAAKSGNYREQGAIAVDEYLKWETTYQEISYESRKARLCVRH